MKNQIIIALIALAFFSKCAKNQTKTTIKVTTDTSTISEKDFALINQFGDTMKIDVSVSNNEFILNGSNLYLGYHMLIISDRTFNLYLTKRNDFHITLVDDKVSFSGSDQAINNYLKRKYSSKFDWYSNYYKTKQTGNMTVYFRDHYIERLKKELQKLTTYDQFVEDELNELNYKYYNQLLLDRIMLQTNPDTNEVILNDVQEAMSINIDDRNALNTSKNFISVAARVLIAQNRIDDLASYYNNINHPNFKTHFLESLVSALHKELQFAEDDFSKSKIVESFITSQQPSDSIGYHIFNLYNKFHDAEGKLANFTYEDVNGELVSLRSLRGKYVYVDFWATWCTNCIKEFPYMKKLESEFEGKEIEFIGISVDKMEAKDRWKKMVAQKELENIQLFAPFQGHPDKDTLDDDFMKLLYVNAYYLGIPHYALIDPNGKIIDAYFYRPSNPKTKEFMSELFLATET